MCNGMGWIRSGRDCRSAARNALAPDARYFNFGFRLARGLADQPDRNLDSKPKNKRYRIFLASPPDLVEDQRELVIFINQQTRHWRARGVFLEFVIWENFTDDASQPELQDEFAKKAQSCDLCVRLFGSKVGLHTVDEYEKLREQFTTTKRPFIYTYFKEDRAAEKSASQRDLEGVLEFKKVIGVLGYLCVDYINSDALCKNFSHQLSVLNLGSDVLAFPKRKTISTEFAARWKGSEKRE